MFTNCLVKSLKNLLVVIISGIKVRVCIMGIEEFLGKRYKMVKQKNFEDYLSHLGKGYVARKTALSLSPEHCLTANEDGTFTFSFTSLLVSSSFQFTPDEEFEEEKPDGEKVISVVTLEDNKMIHTQREPNGRVSKHVREFYNDKLIITTTAEGLDKTVIRYYELVQ